MLGLLQPMLLVLGMPSLLKADLSNKTTYRTRCSAVVVALVQERRRQRRHRYYTRFACLKTCGNKINAGHGIWKTPTEKKKAIHSTCVKSLSHGFEGLTFASFCTKRQGRPDANKMYPPMKHFT